MPSRTSLLSRIARGLVSSVSFVAAGLVPMAAQAGNPHFFVQAQRDPRAIPRERVQVQRGGPPPGRELPPQQRFVLPMEQPRQAGPEDGDGRRLTPDQRRELRRQVRDANRELYTPRQRDGKR